MVDVLSKNRFWQAFGLKYPIIQGPFGGGLSSVDLVAAVSNAGGVGSFGAHHLEPEAIITLVDAITARTQGVFNINLWVSPYDDEAQSLDQARYDDLCAAFSPYYEALDLELPPFSPQTHISFEDQMEAVIEARPPIVSFVYGVPSGRMIERCKSKSIAIMGTATTLKEALLLEEAGVDYIIATGFEAGGHRVSFLHEPESCLTGSMSLIPHIVDAVKIPVIAAGGIADARGVKAAMALGASAVQVGTAFLACDESATSDVHKQILLSGSVQDTVLSRAFTGRLARFIPNAFLENIEQNKALPAPFPLQAMFVSAIKQHALSSGQASHTPLYASQSTGLLQHHKAQEVFNALAQAFSDDESEMTGST